MKTVLRYMSVATLCLALSGCLPDMSASDRVERQEVRRSAQAEGLARSLSVVGSRVHGAFMTNAASPFITGGATTPTQLINYRTVFAMDLGPAGDMVNVGFCNDTAAGARSSLIVWLNSTDSTNHFNPRGLGEGATGTVMSRLAEMSDPGSIGTVENGAISLRSGDTLSLGACQTAFNIPVGAPVMVFANLEVPDEMAVATTRTETRTSACASGQTGTRTETRTISVAANGTETPTAWTLVNEMCSSDMANALTGNINTETADILGGALGSVVGGLSSGDLKNALNSLTETECRETQMTSTRIDPETGRPVTVHYNTCDAEDATIDKVGDLKLTLLETNYELITGPCTATTSDTSGTRTVSNIPDTNNTPLAGTIILRPWQPNPTGATYEREVRTYKLQDPDGTWRETTLRGVLVGKALACKRDELITFPIETFQPNWASIGVNPANLTVSNDDGIDYTRVATVNGWSNAQEQIPNNPGYGAWTLSSIEGAWDERVSTAITCVADGAPGNQIAMRTHTLVGYKRVETSDWTLTDDCKPLCAQIVETDHPDCPSGQSGLITRERTMNTNGQCGAASAWVVKSNTCAVCASDGWTNGACGGSDEQTGVNCSAAEPSYTMVNCAPGERLQTKPRTHTCQPSSNWTFAGQQVRCVADTSCTTPMPTTGAWTTGSWGACSATCDGGTQTRSVTCAYDNCTGTKPAVSQACNMQACSANHCMTNCGRFRPSGDCQIWRTISQPCEEVPGYCLAFPGTSECEGGQGLQ